MLGFGFRLEVKNRSTNGDFTSHLVGGRNLSLQTNCQTVLPCQYLSIMEMTAPSHEHPPKLYSVTTTFTAPSVAFKKTKQTDNSLTMVKCQKHPPPGDRQFSNSQPIIKLLSFNSRKYHAALFPQADCGHAQRLHSGTWWPLLSGSMESIDPAPSVTSNSCMTDLFSFS